MSPPATFVWLWSAGDRYCGVTDDQDAAMAAAGDRLPPGDVAAVQRAAFSLAPGPVGRYIPIGEGWTATAPADGPLAWQPSALPERNAYLH